MKATNKTTAPTFLTRSQFSEIIGEDIYFSISQKKEEVFFDVFFTNGGVYADCVYFAIMRLLDARVDMNAIGIYPIMGDIHLCVTCVDKNEAVDNLVDDYFQYV